MPRYAWYAPLRSKPILQTRLPAEALAKAGPWASSSRPTNAPSLKLRRTKGKPLAVPVEAAGPKAEYLEYHRREVFGN